MNIMVIDCEFNQPSRKTIEIGAAVYKAHTGELLDTYQTYVNPGEPITAYITELTSITDEKVVTGISIEQAYEELKAFHKKHRCFMNPIVWGSTTSNDSDAVYKQSKTTEPNFMGFRVIDAKTIYQSYQVFNNKVVRGGLSTAIKTLGLSWDSRHGDAHNALADAVNTFSVWYKLTKGISL